MSEQESPTPQRQAKKRKAGKGGVVPPAEHRWKPGQSGNPGGAPQGQAYPGRWFAALWEEPTAELRRIVEQEDGSHSRVSAAQLLLDMRDDDPNVRRRAFAEVCDRMAGKPHQTSTVEHKQGETPEQLVERIKRLTGQRVERAREGESN